MVIFVALVIIGGVTRIGKVTEYLVPIMAIFYLLGGVIILFLNFEEIIPAFRNIFVAAFNPQAIGGGVLGATIKEAFAMALLVEYFQMKLDWEVHPHAHAVADVKHPVHQGLVAMTAVFIDTGIVCTMTALIILVSGADYTDYWRRINPGGFCFSLSQS